MCINSEGGKIPVNLNYCVVLLLSIIVVRDFDSILFGKVTMRFFS